jgi:hypothetical protein
MANVRFVPKADSCTAAKILSFAVCPAQRPGGFDAVFPTVRMRLSALSQANSPEYRGGRVFKACR